MAAAPNLDVNVIKKFHPLDSLSLDKVQEVIDKSAVQKIPAGRMLFKQGDKDKWTVYLLSGTIEVKASGSKKQLIKANSEEAKTAIANKIPRPLSAKAKTDISILIIDTDLLDILLNWNAPSSIEVSDLDDEDEDWMTRFLQSSAFLQIPASNIQALMMRLHETPLAKGSVIIKENDANDNQFYIIQQGRCLVTKTNPVSGDEITLAELRLGDGFGEEALITGGIRGASVTMKTDGVILTLDKKDFIELLVLPLIHRISKQEVNTLDHTKQQLVDVRNENEFASNGLENSLNIPLNLIRSQLSELSTDKHYITYSGQEGRSIAGAFLFIQQGFDCSIIEGGIGSADIPAEQATQADKKSITRDNDTSQTTSSDVETKPRQLQKPVASPEQRNENLTSPEVEAERKKAEAQAEQLSKADTARKEAESMAADLRGEAQEALKKAEEEAKRAQHAELALKTAQLRAVQLEAQQKDQGQTSSLELDEIKKQVEEETRLKAEAEASRAKAEQEAEKLRQEADSAREQAEKEALRASQAESARKEAEEKAKELHKETVKKKSDEVNDALEKAKSEAERAENAEHEALRLREESEQARQKAEEEAKRAADAEQARKDAEEAIRQASQEQLSEKEAALEKARQQSQEEAKRAEKAIEEAKRVREEAEQALQQSEELAKLSTQAESELLNAKEEIERLRKDADARQHAEIHEARIKAQEEKERAEKIDAERQSALAEVERLQQEMQQAKNQMANDLDNQQQQQVELQEQQLGHLKASTEDE
ncbi:MAG: cyclic nucleotide-binding domain-containing protein, partial [gamma proteobacterium symbiont of Lucinoma myriamae]|nr:cyclic nucleotide-binding domain-containing protein [gamma proteobacterium symbiont of Lucinoma myriamae]